MSSAGVCCLSTEELTIPMRALLLDVLSHGRVCRGGRRLEFHKDNFIPWERDSPCPPRKLSWPQLLKVVGQ
jgi:hypothetical protein